jgi:hypothetical protein
MRQGIQSTIEHLQIRQSGCLFLCNLKIIEIITRTTLTDERVIEIYRDAVVKGIMRPDCFINDNIRFMNEYQTVQRFTRRVDQETIPNNMPCIIRLVKPRFTHFVVGIKKEGTRVPSLWDPLDPRRAGAAGYSPDQYRFYQ